jgi:hypothetical protein
VIDNKARAVAKCVRPQFQPMLTYRDKVGFFRQCKPHQLALWVPDKGYGSTIGGGP